MAETARAQRGPGNLPAELSSFVGRVAERLALKRLLAVSRLVTVTGVGGVGKTRTVLRVAAEVRRAFRDGVWLVDLSGLTRADLVVEAVAQTVGLRDQSTRPLAEVLAEYLADRRVLLVLDNCEHLVESCGKLVGSLLRASAGLRVLATSRQPFGVPGEHVFSLLPLPVPVPDAVGRSGGVLAAEHEADAAVVLFVERAQASSPDFALTAANQDAVARLCRALDGIPLAIELAAVRTRALPVQQIAELLEGRIASRFTLLSKGMTGRHESLRTVIDWSYGLCTWAEGLLWARLSVFAGNFNLDAVQQVCADDRLAEQDILLLLVGLIDKSILLAEDHTGEARYRLLDTIREYGRELLQQSDEDQRMRRRHRDFYLRLVRRFDAEWCGPDQIGWYTRLTREHSNLRAALDFSLSHETEHQAGVELAAALLHFWIACGHTREGRHYLDWALALDPAPGPALTKALWVCARVTALQGDREATQARLASCRVHAAAQADTVAAGWIAYVAGLVAVLQGDPVRALALTQEAADLHRHGGDPGMGLLSALAGQCFTLGLTGDIERAVAAVEQAWVAADECGERWARSYTEIYRARAEIGRRDPCAAVRYCRDALHFKRQLGDSAGCAMAVDVLAGAAASLGEAERAARLIGVAHRIWQTVGVPQLGSPDLAAARTVVENQARGSIGDRGFQDAYAEGLNLDIDAGIDYALAEPAPRQAEAQLSLSTWAPLTRREREVAVLVSEGLTNQQIADRLVVSRRTANTHLEHILTKLDFTSRAQIAAWAAARPPPTPST